MTGMPQNTRSAPVLSWCDLCLRGWISPQWVKKSLPLHTSTWNSARCWCRRGRHSHLPWKPAHSLSPWTPRRKQPPWNPGRSRRSCLLLPWKGTRRHFLRGNMIPKKVKKSTQGNREDAKLQYRRETSHCVPWKGDQDHTLPQLWWGHVPHPPLSAGRAGFTYQHYKPHMSLFFKVHGSNMWKEVQYF